MIVTILGGSAPSTPSLIDWLARNAPEACLTVRLVGRSSEHLEAVGHASRILARMSSITVQQYSFGNWKDAIEDADCVLIQVRIGGLNGRQFDEAFPVEYGVPGDEGLGPGGLSAALRTWPVVRRIIEQLQLCAPLCLPVLLTSPGSLLTRLAAREFPQFPIYSICELPYTTLDDVCRCCSRSVEDVQFSYAGVNHLGWLYDLRCDGEDLFENYRARNRSSLSRALYEYGAVPMKYLRLHFDREALVAEQRSCEPGNSRAAKLAAMQQRAFLAFQEGSVRGIRCALAERKTPWYCQATGPLLLRLSGSDAQCEPCPRPFFLSTADEIGEVSERPYAFERGSFRALCMTEPPAAVRALNRRYVDYERQAAWSLHEPSPQTIAKALAIHPWVDGHRTATRLADTLWRHFSMLSEGEDQMRWLN